MKKIINDLELDFGDVLIQQQASYLSSRLDANISREFKFLNSKTKLKCYPVIASNMLTGSFDMADALKTRNCLTALHKHHPRSNLVDYWEANNLEDNHVFYTLGMSKGDLDKYKSFKEQISFGLQQPFMPTLVCIDIAHGGMKDFVRFVAKFKSENPETIVMAGNVSTGELTGELMHAGADIIKVGIGSGANCLTRKIAGVGRPQLSAVLECADVAHTWGRYICSDGGITQPADVNIAFAAGADFVMIGSMFSGTDECEGEIVEHNGKFHKKFFGMSSTTAMESFSEGKDHYKASEGRTTLVPCKGSVIPIIEELQGATRSMMSYIGAENLSDVKSKAVLTRVNSRLNMMHEKHTIGN